MATQGILTEEMKRMVREQRLAYVATVCPDGTPSLSHKGTLSVWGEDQLVFADIRSPGTVENLKRNPAVEINVVDPVVRKGYRFKGAATVLTGGPLFEQIVDFYRSEVERADERIRSIVLISVERASSMTSPAYDLGYTEEQVREKWARYYSSLQTDQAAPPASE